MNRYLGSIGGQAMLLLVVLLFLTNMLALWLYSYRHVGAADTLHDAMVAEQLATIFRLVERAPAQEANDILLTLKGSAIDVDTSSVIDTIPDPSDVRSVRVFQFLEHFLGSDTVERVKVTFLKSSKSGDAILTRGSKRFAHKDAEFSTHSLLTAARIQGSVQATSRLTDGSYLTLQLPMIAVPHVSIQQIAPSLFAIFGSAVFIAYWLLSRFTAPLRYLGEAAARFGSNFNAPLLDETGPSEVRSAVSAFNHMQRRIKRLIEDRSATAAAIAHDLGTPVTRLRLKIEEISDETLRKRLLGDVEQMQRMITSALDFSRLDFSTEDFHRVDVTSLLESMCEDYAEMNAKVTFRPAGRMVIFTKPMLLRRALNNVIENALKYGKSAELEIRTDPDCTTITIDDHGPGIDEALQEIAFKPFHRLEDRNLSERGTGLGLTIARRIIESLGGTISLSNRESRGLSVKIVLPNGNGNELKTLTQANLSHSMGKCVHSALTKRP